MEIFLTLSMYMDDGLSSVKMVWAIYVVQERMQRKKCWDRIVHQIELPFTE